MKFYSSENVFDAALRRIRWLFDEFEHVTVNFSGGKDSTVCLYLALMVAEERGRLPLDVMFIDQEAEWGCVIDYIRDVMSDPRVKPHWMQIPFKIFNATSTTDQWLHCWEPGKEDLWIRPQEPNSIKVNDFHTDRFTDIFEGYQTHRFPNEKAVYIAGVRAEESPARLKGLTSYETYKGETWGKKEDVKRGHYTFYPIYDWSYTDVWKAIHNHGWAYCKLYDYMYQYGVPVMNMRVSNVHHETAIKSLFFLQEIEGATWNKITNRVSGINTAGQMKDKFFAPKKLPSMFKDWREYRDHIIDKLAAPEHKEKFARDFAAADRRYVPEVQDDLCKIQIAAVLSNDYHGTKMSSFAASHGWASINAGSKGGIKAGIPEGQPIYDN